MITKTYRIEDIIFTELSPKKGSIEYFLVDSVMQKRKVTGVAKLGFNGKIKSVTAVFNREKPLVDALVHADVGERITVDFSEFNKTPREQVSSVKHVIPSARSTGDINATMVYQEAYQDMQYVEKIRSFLPDLSKLGLWAILLFLIWMAFMAVNQFAGLVK